MGRSLGGAAQVRFAFRWAAWSLWLTGCVVMAARYAARPRDLDAAGLSFVWLVFLGILPCWNAVLDTVSVGATRHFLRRYIATGQGWWWMVLLDIAIALGLTAVLFAGVFVLFHGMQAAGWHVDAAAMVQRFRDEPTSAEVSWVLWMAVTNVLPTLLHLGLACAGVWAGWLFRDEGFAAGLRDRIRPAAPDPVPPATSAAALLGADGRALAAAPLAAAPVPQPERLMVVEGLSPAQAQKLVNWVYIDWRLAAALPWCVALAGWPLLRDGLHAVLGWLL